MKNLILILALLLTLQGYAQQRIIGGNEISITERPFQVHIEKKDIENTYYGGGCIIAPQWILTAAHVVCFDDTEQKVGVEDLKIRYGSSRWTEGNIMFVDQIIIHPEYNKTSLKNDIALVHLSSPLSFFSTCQPIVMSDVVGLTSGEAIVSGWGNITTVGNSGSLSLKATTVSLIPYTHSSIKFKDIILGPWHLFAAASLTMHAGGDSGGPLTVSSEKYGRILAGVVSFSAKTDQQSHPSGYANVGYYREWIRQQTGIGMPTITGNDIIHTEGYYGFSGLFCPSINASWNISNRGIATINSSGQVIRQGTASGQVKLTSVINNFGIPITLTRDILIGLPPFDISCLQQSVMENYRVGTTYNFFADPQWGDGILANNRLTYDWGYSKLSSTGQAGEWIRVNTYNNASFVDTQPAFRFTEPGTYRIEMYVRDGSVTSGMNSKTITVTGNYYSVYMNPACTQLTFTPQIQDMESEILPSLFSTLYSSTVKVHIYSDTSLKFSTILSATNDTNIDISSLDKGIYYLVILKDNAVIERHKILIRR